MMNIYIFLERLFSSKPEEKMLNEDENENDSRNLVDPPQRDTNTHATTNVETLMHLFKGLRTIRFIEEFWVKNLRSYFMTK